MGYERGRQFVNKEAGHLLLVLVFLYLVGCFIINIYLGKKKLPESEGTSKWSAFRAEEMAQ